MTAPHADADGPAEARLHELLEPVRTGAPTAHPGLPAAVVRRARWQREARGALRIAGMLAAAAGDAATLLLGRRPGGPR